MQVIKSRMNGVGKFGIVLTVLPLPAIGGLWLLMEQSNDAALNIYQVTGSKFPTLYEFPYVALGVAAFITIIGVVMMLTGKDTYISEVSA